MIFAVMCGSSVAEATNGHGSAGDTARLNDSKGSSFRRCCDRHAFITAARIM